MINQETLENKRQKLVKKCEKIHKKVFDIYIIKDLRGYYEDLYYLQYDIKLNDRYLFYYIDNKLNDINKILNRINREYGRND